MRICEKDLRTFFFEIRFKNKMGGRGGERERERRRDRERILSIKLLTKV